MNKEELKEKYKGFDTSELNIELMKACASGDKSIVEYILDVPGFKEELRKNNFNIVLFTASSRNNWHIIKCLLQADILENEEALIPYLNGALGYACSGGALDVVKYFLTSPELKYHADINYSNNQPLIYACESGHIEIVKYLLTSSELEKHVSLDNNDALDWACIGGHLDIVKYLLSFDKINKNKDFTNILNQALKYSIEANKLDVVKYLCSYSEADISYSNYEGFRTACDRENNDVVEYLIFDFNMEKTEDIKEYFKNFPNKKLEDMFEVRDLKKSLNNDLKINKNISKKNKL